MKKIVITVLLACFGYQSFYGQEQLKLSLKKDTDKTVNETEHFYLMEITNDANKNVSFNIAVENSTCEDISTDKQVQLNLFTLDKHKGNSIKALTIKPGESLEFYVKISREKNTKIGTWSCSEVKAISDSGKPVSNSVIIKSLIPDPKNFN